MISSFSSYTDVFLLSYRTDANFKFILIYHMICGGGLYWSMEKYTDIDLKPEVELLRVNEGVGRVAFCMFLILYDTF